LAVLALVCSAARAEDPSAGERAQAEALFHAAKDLQSQHKLSEACPKYAESNRLDPKPGTALNLAVCHEEDGKTASAWVEFLEAAKLAARAHQPDREKYAKKRADDVEKRLSKVKFVTQEPSEHYELRLDGRPMRTSVLGTALPLDPGSHELSAELEGRTKWEHKFDVPSGPSELTVEIPTLVVLPPPPPTPAPSPPPPIVPQRPAESQNLTPPLLVGGIGVVGLGLGTVFGIRTLSAKGDVDANCVGRQCTATGLEANDDARSAATISTVAFVAGGACVVGAVVLYLIGRPSARANHTYLAPALGGFVAGGAF
jgi:hypothetical protein